MLPFVPILKNIQVRQIILQRCIQFLVVLSLLLISPSKARAEAASPMFSISYHKAEYLATTAASAKQTSKEVDKAADGLYQGLDTTKKIIGKTKQRNESIGFARDKARQKLKALSDKVEASNGQLDRSLTPTEKLAVENLENNKK